MMDRIRLSQPTVTPEIKEALMKTLDSGWFGNGPVTAELEKALTKRLGFKYCVCTSSGTAALHLALLAYGLQGGELITTPMTFVSDAIVGEYQGMDITFGDIEEDSLCLDSKSIVVTERTQAIIVVDSHGRLADMEGIKKASWVDIAGVGGSRPILIEDAAHAMHTPGIGKHADILMLSFQAVKTMPTADGGALLTNDEYIYQKLKKLRWLGVEKTTWERAKGKKYFWDYDITHETGLGIKAYMNDIQASIALGQLKRLDEMLVKRRKIQDTYNEALLDIPQIKLPMFSYTVQYYTPQFEDRDNLTEYLSSKNIDNSVHFKPLSEMTAYKKYVKYPIPVTDRVWRKLLSLPVHDALTEDQQNYVIRCVKEFYGK